MFRYIFFRLLFLKTLFTKRHVKFKGWCVIATLSGSSIKIGNGTSIFSDFSSNMLGLYQRCIIVSRYGGKIIIGEKCGISGSTIYSTDKIEIGNYTLIGANCKIVDNDFHPLDRNKRHESLDREFTLHKPIKIGDDCFIGMNSIILKGTKLGDNVIVGAGSVVCGEFPSNVVIAGNPARIIRNLEPFNDSTFL